MGVGGGGKMAILLGGTIGHFPAFYVVLVPLEYILTIPPHSSYVIEICFVLFKSMDFSVVAEWQNYDICRMRRYSRNIFHMGNW